MLINHDVSQAALNNALKHMRNIHKERAGCLVTPNKPIVFAHKQKLTQSMKKFEKCSTQSSSDKSEVFSAMGQPHPLPEYNYSSADEEEVVSKT